MNMQILVTPWLSGLTENVNIYTNVDKPLSNNFLNALNDPINPDDVNVYIEISGMISFK